MSARNHTNPGQTQGQNQNQNQPNKPRRRRVGIAIIVVAALVLVACVGIIVALALGGRVGDNGLSGSSGNSDPAQIAAESEQVDVSPDGVVYMNNELLVYVQAGATDAEARELFSAVGASTVDDTMSDIGLYRLIFAESLSYDELTSKLETLNASALVDNALLDPVALLEPDDTDDEESTATDSATETTSPVYPDDPWDGSSWDISVPRDANWGMEAIDAPGAWAYLDELEEVRVGLIDSLPNTGHEDLKDVFGTAVVNLIDAQTGSVTQATSQTATKHGSHVAGIMAADWDNGAGVSGVMGGKGRIYYCQTYYTGNTTTEQEYGTAYSYLLSLKTLIDQDVQVINISQHTSHVVCFAASQGNQNALNHLQQEADAAEIGLKNIIAQREEAGRSDFVICMSAGNVNGYVFRPDASQTYGYYELGQGDKVTSSDQQGGALAIYNNFLNLIDDADVQNRIIVVGAVGIDTSSSTASETRYEYAYYSTYGSRVDVVAPGTDIYSCDINGYVFDSGTSMAAPHVSGVAGLVFAANPDLSGPDVKRIVVASAEGRYYHGSSYSGMVNARTAVELALSTRDESVSRVVSSNTTNGLDLCFVVDTTASMRDDIANARENMEDILANLAERTENFRVAIVDYRDFPSRTNDADDYASRVQLNFTNDVEAITQAINDLGLGNGGDTEETVYSGLLQAVNLGWRDDAKKVIIVLGDAAPLDPEPITGYTYGDVLTALYNGGIGIDFDSSDERVLGEPDESLINVFSIGTNASDDAMDFFDGISSDTGGSSVDISDASEVSDAISSSIEQIEVEAGVTAELDFGTDMAGARIDLYAAEGGSDADGGAAADGAADGDAAADGAAGSSSATVAEPGEYLFSFTTDGSGCFTVEALPAGSYVWTTDGPAGGGTLSVATGGVEPTIETSDSFWFAPVMKLWQDSAALIVCGLILVVAACIGVPVVVSVIAGRVRSQQRPPRGGSAGGGQRCPHCGGTVAPEARFCRNCGRQI